jgi:hypothetical protein
MCEVERAYNFLLARGKSKDALDKVLQSDTPENLIWWVDDVLEEEMDVELVMRFDHELAGWY